MKSFFNKANSNFIGFKIKYEEFTFIELCNLNLKLYLPSLRFELILMIIKKYKNMLLNDLDMVKEFLKSYNLIIDNIQTNEILSFELESVVYFYDIDAKKYVFYFKIIYNNLIYRIFIK